MIEKDNKKSSTKAFSKNEIKGLILSIIISLISIPLLGYTNLAVVSLLVGFYLIVLFLPSLAISKIFNYISKGTKEEFQSKCGGLPNGGLLIGYSERSMIFLAFLIIFLENTVSYNAILSFLSFIVAGKAIFRFSSKDSGDRTCADWYILGTFLSLLFGLFLSWIIFHYLSVFAVV